MTDKEQIPIYVKVGCHHLCLGECSREFGSENGNCVGTIKCIDNLIEQLARKTQECEELKERIKCNCFDPKSNNNRCISYNRIAEDYEKDLKHLKNKIAECEKYEQLFDELDKRVSNCIEIYDCIIVSKIVKDIIIKAKGEGNE